jgi:hypothetical protein
MRHLFNSTVSIQRQTEVFTNGLPTRTWVDRYTGVKCRLDLHHKTLASRPERAVQEAGTTPDLMGSLFMEPTVDVRVGDRVKFTSGLHNGRIFSVEDTPAMVGGYSAPHHLEWAVSEVAHA